MIPTGQRVSKASSWTEEYDSPSLLPSRDRPRPGKCSPNLAWTQNSPNPSPDVAAKSPADPWIPLLHHQAVQRGMLPSSSPRNGATPSPTLNHGVQGHPKVSSERTSLPRPSLPPRKRLREVDLQVLDLSISRSPSKRWQFGATSERGEVDHVSRSMVSSGGGPVVTCSGPAGHRELGKAVEEVVEEVVKEVVEEEERQCGVASVQEGRQCAVCGDHASGKFFGATVCLPCKSFFIRCTKDGGPNIEKQCEGKCDVSKDLRHRCQYCRFQRCLHIGMARKEKPEVVVAGEGQTLCRVCGDLANGIHFGVFTCEGCKKFFRRSLKEHRSYACHVNGGCLVNPRNRNHCRRCRYLKCKAVGMSREAIKMGRPRKCGSSSSSNNNISISLSRDDWQRATPVFGVRSPFGMDHRRFPTARGPSSRPLTLDGPRDHHPLPPHQHAQLVGRRGAGRRLVMKQCYAPWFLHHQRRCSLPSQRSGNRKTGVNDVTKKGPRPLVVKSMSFDGVPPPPPSSTSHSVGPGTQSLPSSLPQSIRVGMDSTPGERDQSRLAGHTYTATSVCSPNVSRPAPPLRDVSCLSPDSRVLRHCSNPRQQSLPSFLSSSHEFAPSGCSEWNHRKTPARQPSVSIAEAVTVSQQVTPTSKHLHIPGCEDRLCGIRFSPQRQRGCHATAQKFSSGACLQAIPSSEPDRHSDPAGYERPAPSLGCLQSFQYHSTTWKSVPDEHEHSSGGFDFCHKDPTHTPSEHTKQVSVGGQKRSDLGGCGTLKPRAAVRTIALNINHTDSLCNANAAGLRVGDDSRERNPLDLSCSSWPRHTSSGGPEHVHLIHAHNRGGCGWESSLQDLEQAEPSTSGNDSSTSCPHSHGHSQQQNGTRPSPQQHAAMKDVFNSRAGLMQSLIRIAVGSEGTACEHRSQPQRTTCDCAPCTQHGPPSTIHFYQTAEPPVLYQATPSQRPRPSGTPTMDKELENIVIKKLRVPIGEKLRSVSDVISEIINLAEPVRRDKKIPGFSPDRSEMTEPLSRDTMVCLQPLLCRLRSVIDCAVSEEKASARSRSILETVLHSLQLLLAASENS